MTATYIPLKYKDLDKVTVDIDWPQTVIYMNTTEEERYGVYYRGKAPGINEVRVNIFCGPIDPSHPNKAINIVEIEGTLNDKKMSQNYEDVDVEFILKLQAEHKLYVHHVSHHPATKRDIFEPVAERKRIDICEVLEVEPPAYARASDGFTFKFLKDTYKALGMTGFSSKSKEDLLDGILERMTKDSEENKPKGSGKLVRSLSYYQKQNAAPKGTEAVSDYKEAIGITGRIVGNCFMSPDATPNPDARTLEAVFEVIEIRDPYEGLDRFLEEQKPKKKKKVAKKKVK